MSKNYIRPRILPTPEQIAARNQRVVAAVKSGVTRLEVGRRFGINEAAVTRICHDAGYEPPRGRKSYA
jgi:hypothetical protein